MQGDWNDPDRHWWLKVRHAKGRLDELALVERSYLDRAPWRLLRETTTVKYETAFRLLLREPPPSDVALIAGEVTHALSSALDALAFGIARARVGAAVMDADESLQRLPDFPVQYSWSDMRKWGRDRRRPELFGPRELKALWFGQSCYWRAGAWEEFQIGPEPGSEAEVAARRWDPLTRLRYLDNVDKHRRLHVALLAPEVPHWFSSGDSPRGISVASPWVDGQIVARVLDPPSEVEDSDINWDLRLAFAERGIRSNLVDELTNLHGQTVYALGRVIQGLQASTPIPGSQDDSAITD